MKNFQNKLLKYAELAIKIGLNIKDGQKVVINAPIHAVEFVRAATEKAYELGASDVHVFWSDEDVTLKRMKHASDSALDVFPQWQADGLVNLAKEGAAFLNVSSVNPDLLAGVDSTRVGKANKAASIALKPYKEFTGSAKVQWTIAAVPSESWAKKIFPELNGEEAVDALWNQIFKITRADKEDPVKAWNEHLDALARYKGILNENKLEKIRLKSEVTDLEIKLPERHRWMTAGFTTQEEWDFTANVPTEEVFTAPLREGVNGVVKSTKPLNFAGNLIEDFTLTFKDGKVVDFSAEKGQDVLENILNMDENARYLGEVALVPHSSPISQSDLVFYNTLYDENASCHLAFGYAIPTCLECEPSKEELEKNGANISITHVDFMVGSADMNITGYTREGKEIEIFKQGNWSI